MVMAIIYTNCGRYDDAIDELDYVLSLEVVPTANMLKFQPWVKPLEDLPRYKELLKKYAFAGESS